MPNFNSMKPGRKSIIITILLIFCLIVRWYCSGSERVEQGYSNRFFPAVAGSLRWAFGKISVSIGDIVIGLFLALVMYKIARFIYIASRRQPGLLKLKILRNLPNLFISGLVIYILFYIFWGINYSRQGISSQLALSNLQYITADLTEINCVLIQKINTSKLSLIKAGKPYPSSRELFVMVAGAYEQLAKHYPYLQYKPSSLKSSLWGWFGNYSGFSGYYNPFTGEAQVNTTIPKFLQPYTACHEVGHQIGYAKEMEANFVGYLAAAASKDTLLHYSVYLDLFTYANRNLAMVDSSTARLYRKELIQPVKDDIKEWILFSEAHRGALEPVVRWVYGKYLQGNEQPQGMMSYDAVTAFIIAYYKKFGKI